MPRSLDKNARLRTLVALCVAASQLVWHAQGADRSLSPDETVNIVLRENPVVKSARAKWEMIKARVPQASAWEDLRLGIDSVAGRFVNIPANSFMNQTVTLEQELPVSGKNRSRARVATAEAGAAFEDYRRAELDTASRARGSCSRLANGYAQLEVSRRNEELLNQFIKISETRYETSAATQSDVLTAQTDLAKLLETRADIQRQISEEQSALNVLMNRPAQSPLGEPATTRFYAARVLFGEARSNHPGSPTRDPACTEFGRGGEVPARTRKPPMGSRSDTQFEGAAI